MIAVQKALHEDRVIGDIRAIYSDLSINFEGHVDDSNRVFNPELAGGMLLDLGPYPMLWVSHLASLGRVISFITKVGTDDQGNDDTLSPSG